MKLWIGIAIALVFFSGCNSRTQTIALQKRSAQQALLIQKQQLQIDTLKEKLDAKAKARARARARARAKRQSATVPVTKKNIKLKKVEDNNFSSGYMYPQTKAKPTPKPAVKLAQASATTSTSSIMGKAECIAMIGQGKFDKYTQMFGSESASIKRCKMLKAMRN
jgi:hypothetical protein